MDPHAFTLLEVKAIDAEQRVITGIASTPTVDRQGHSLDPMGARFKNPLPLFLHHDQRLPVGSVTLSASPAGLAFRAELPLVSDPGPLKDRIDETWQSLKAGLLPYVSVGYRVLEQGAERLTNGLLRLMKTEVVELSLTAMPVNPEAVVLSLKSLSADLLVPAAPRRLEKHAMKQTTAEHIQNLENKRAALAARMTDIMRSAADEDRTLNDEESTEHDGIGLQVKSIDADLTRWRDHERLQITTATPVPAIPGSHTITPFAHVSVKPNVPLGTQFVRAVCAKVYGSIYQQDPIKYAQDRWGDSTPEVALYLKAAIAPGTATDAAWAAPLVNLNIATDFLELLRPATILGKVPGLRNVPFNTKVPSQTAGGSYGWVGEAKPKPVTKLAFSSVTLPYAKVAGIIVLTEELVRLSSPSAEALVRADMIAGIAQFLDTQFIDPAVAAVAGVSPASITNGADTAAATANPMADIMGLVKHFSDNNIDVTGLTFIMSPSNALSLSFRSNLDGSPQFPGVTIDGGSYKGLNFVTSNTAGTNVIAVQPRLVLYADDGGVTIDASREASLQMDSAPASPADATTVYVSLWQTNTVGLRAERWASWLRAHAKAVKYLTAAAWPAPTGAAAPPPEG